jgi:PIN domain-containing protein
VSVVYDAGVLVGADRNERRVWAEHRVRLEGGTIPVVPSVVVAQVSRSARQVQLRRFLKGCDVAVLDETAAHAAGELLGRAGTDDVCDAAVVATAAGLAAEIVTGDRKDLRRLVAASGKTISLRDV